jgi:uncharacterized protein YecE (DUF72 family)
MAKERTKFFVGTSGWTYDDWKGRFYPEDLPKSRWFEYYASRFSTVEVNATFYRAFKDETYQKWRERAPEGFGYVLKAPRNITHLKQLVDVEADIAEFCRSAALLGDKLEMILLQVAPGTPYDLERLRRALLAFSDPAKVAVEFRKSRWFTEEVEQLLKEVGATYCNPDSPSQKLTGILTSDRAYLRMHGRKNWYLYNYSDEELKEIAGIASDVAQRGAKRVYIYFNNDYEGHGPANALDLLIMLRV